MVVVCWHEILMISNIQSTKKKKKIVKQTHDLYILFIYLFEKGHICHMTWCKQTEWPWHCQDEFVLQICFFLNLTTSLVECSEHVVSFGFSVLIGWAVSFKMHWIIFKSHCWLKICTKTFKKLLKKYCLSFKTFKTKIILRREMKQVQLF